MTFLGDKSAPRRNALVIGANGGMGSAVVQILQSAGWDVWATVSRREGIDDFRALFPKCICVEAVDLADADRVLARTEELMLRMTQVDAVIVCAAVAPFAPAEMTPLRDFRQTMEINCVSNLAIYRSSLPWLRKTKGRLVLTGSYSGRIATPVMASYVASKFALEGLCDVMRQEAQAWGVDVVLIQPGALDTQMMRRSQINLARTISELPKVEEDLYGLLYRQMKYRADEGIENSNFTSPRIAAEAVLRALEADAPAARYPVGADAGFMLDMARTKSDREIDQFVLDLYRSAPLDGGELNPASKKQASREMIDDASPVPATRNS